MRIADCEQTDSVIMDELFISAVIGIFADRQNGNLVAQLLLQLNQRGHFFDAGRTPRRPEVQHHWLAAQLAQSDSVLRISNAEIGSRIADARRMRTAVTTSQ